MGKDYIEWQCDECKESPDRLNRIVGIPKRFLCDECSENVHNTSQGGGK